MKALPPGNSNGQLICTVICRTTMLTSHTLLNPKVGYMTSSIPQSASPCSLQPPPAPTAITTVRRRMNFTCKLSFPSSNDETNGAVVVRSRSSSTSSFRVVKVTPEGASKNWHPGTTCCAWTRISLNHSWASPLAAGGWTSFSVSKEPQTHHRAPHQYWIFKECAMMRGSIRECDVSYTSLLLGNWR